MVEALMYISRSNLAYPNDGQNLEEIRNVSLARNSAAELTGFLVSTPEHFLQYLEGPRQDLAAIMQSIRADARHYAINEVEVPVGPSRRYARWQLKCFFPSTYVSRFLEPALENYHADIPLDKVSEIISFVDRVSNITDTN
jgi:hypothetical protein